MKYFTSVNVTGWFNLKSCHHYNLEIIITQILKLINTQISKLITQNIALGDPMS